VLTQAEESLDELVQLAVSAGADVQGRLLQSRETATAATLIGSGKVQELAELVAASPRVTGLVVHNEAPAEHVLVTLRELGRRVPGDMSVVAICPDEMAERADPPLTSVQIPAEEVGTRAVDLLMRKLTGAEAPESTLLPPVLTARASTKPPPP